MIEKEGVITLLLYLKKSKKLPKIPLQSNVYVLHFPYTHQLKVLITTCYMKGVIIMARKKTNYTLEEKISMLTEEIASMEEYLKATKEQKRELEKELKEQQMNDIYNLIQAKGLDLEQVKDIIANTEVNDTTEE